MDFTAAAVLTFILVVLTASIMSKIPSSEDIKYVRIIYGLTGLIGILLPLLKLTWLYVDLVTDNTFSRTMITCVYTGIVVIHFVILLFSKQTKKEYILRIIVTGVSILVFFLVAPFTIGGIHFPVISLILPGLSLSYSNKLHHRFLSFIVLQGIAALMIFLSSNVYFDGTVERAVQDYIEPYEDVVIHKRNSFQTNQKPIGIYGNYGDGMPLTLVYYKGVIYNAGQASVAKTSQKILKNLGEVTEED